MYSLYIHKSSCVIIGSFCFYALTMKLGICTLVLSSCICFFVCLQKGLLNVWVDQFLSTWNEKIQGILLHFNIFNIQYPESYQNNEKVRGVFIRDIEKDAYKVYPILKNLKQKDYFRVFKVNLHKTCTFFKMNEKCTNKRHCSVCECEDNEIPENFKTNSFEIIESKTNTEDMKKTFLKNELYSDILGIYDNSGDGFVSYIDLVYNSPSYTGYKGRYIWDKIYKENCFSDNENECKEIKNFYNIISGMQSNIALLSSEYFYLLNEKELERTKLDSQFFSESHPQLKYTYNISFFKEKIALYPKRIENLFFTFAILLRAVCRLKNLFKQCKCNSGYEDNDKEAVSLLNELLENSYFSCSSKEFLEPLFPTQGNPILHKFSNITKIIDCVPCVKCRLHGKLKTAALQIALIEGVSDKNIGSLERNEITAFINALYYFADSIIIIKKFEERLKIRKMFFIFFFFALLLFKCLLIYSIIFLINRKSKKQKMKKQ